MRALLKTTAKLTHTCCHCCHLSIWGSRTHRLAIQQHSRIPVKHAAANVHDSVPVIEAINSQRSFSIMSTGAMTVSGSQLTSTAADRSGTSSTSPTGCSPDPSHTCNTHAHRQKQGQPRLTAGTTTAAASSAMNETVIVWPWGLLTPLRVTQCHDVLHCSAVERPSCFCVCRMHLAAANSVCSCSLLHCRAGYNPNRQTVFPSLPPGAMQLHHLWPCRIWIFGPEASLYLAQKPACIWPTSQPGGHAVCMHQ